MFVLACLLVCLPSPSLNVVFPLTINNLFNQKLKKCATTAAQLHRMTATGRTDRHIKICSASPFEFLLDA